MGNRIQEMDKYSATKISPMHMVVPLPPNDADYYATTIAATGNWADGDYTYTLAKNYPSWPSTVHGTLTVTTGWASGDSVTIEIGGYDLDYQVVTEQFTITHSATSGRTDGLFTRVTSAKVVAVTGTLASESLAIGIGNGTASPDIGVAAPGRVNAAGDVVFVSELAGVVSTPDGTCHNRRGVTLDYAATVNSSITKAVFTLDERTVRKR